jgi:hypothetical protein
MKLVNPDTVGTFQLARFRLHPWQPFALSALLAIVLYAITLGGGYVYDDRVVVKADPRISEPGLWTHLWTGQYFDHGNDNLYRPIVSSSYALQWHLHGDRPWLFHLVNVLLHAMVAGAVAEFTRRVLNAAVGLMAGLIFAAHPIHVEAVANIVGRAELACAACIFIALILLVHRPITYGRVAAIVTVGMTGVLCKEQGIIPPLLWILVGLLLWKQSIVDDRPAIRIFVLTTCWTWAGYLLLREHFLKFEWDRSSLDPTVQPLLLSLGWDRMLMPVVLLGHYTALLIVPLHLSPDYGAEVIGHVARWHDPYLWLGFAAILSWVGIALISARSALHAIAKAGPANGARAQFLLFCLLAMAITYGVVGNIVTLIGTNFAERLMYLPSAFFVMIVAAGLAMLPVRARVLFTAAILILTSIRTVTAAHDWNRPERLFENALAVHPQSIQLHFLLAEEYQLQGNLPAAEAVLKDACDRYPNYWRVWQHRCEEAIAAKNFTAAEGYLKTALRLEHAPILVGLGDRLEKEKAATRP